MLNNLIYSLTLNLAPINSADYQTPNTLLEDKRLRNKLRNKNIKPMTLELKEVLGDVLKDAFNTVSILDQRHALPGFTREKLNGR